MLPRRSSGLGLVLGSLLAAAASGSERPAPDLTREPTLYVVGYAHLDTQWRWTYPQVIREMIPATMRKTFLLFQLYPDYIFNFSGANRYRMMKEYYPAAFDSLKRYVVAGCSRAAPRWRNATSNSNET
jgi:alpha-mannosidase